MAGSPLQQLGTQGVSIWLDDLSRGLLSDGDLAFAVQDRNVTGVTTNPVIFQRAITERDAVLYQGQLRDLALRGVTAEEAVRTLTATDVRQAADVLRPVHDRSNGYDGYVSIEVDPRFAHRTDATVAEARHLWWTVDRPNVLIKIPATSAGLPAITQTVAEGIGVNATLIFSVERYRAVADAYLAGLELARDAGQDLSSIRSVASVFVSRLDTETDRLLEKAGRADALELRGLTALANSRLAHQAYQSIIQSERWQALQKAGARPQRLLWTSTSTKNHRYSDTLYVTELVTSGTISSMPRQTLDAVGDHGDIRGDTVRAQYGDARRVFDNLAGLGISYERVTESLEAAGIEAFQESWNLLLESVNTSLAHLSGIGRA